MIMDLGEQDFINGIKNGDMKVLDQVYSLFLPKITAFIRSKGGTTEDAHDTFQDALVIIFEKTRQEDFKIEKSFYAFLYRVCRNLWGNRLQKKSMKEVTLPDQIKHLAEEDIFAFIVQEEREQLFWTAFKKLGADCQQIFQLAFQKKSTEEIRQIMGFSSKGYTKKRKHICKGKWIELVRADVKFTELVK